MGASSWEEEHEGGVLMGCRKEKDAYVCTDAHDDGSVYVYLCFFFVGTVGCFDTCFLCLFSICLHFFVFEAQGRAMTYKATKKYHFQ